MIFFGKNNDKINLGIKVDGQIITDLEYIKIVEERINNIKSLGIDQNDEKEIKIMLIALKNIKERYLKTLEEMKKLIKEYELSNNEYKNKYIGQIKLKQKTIETTLDTINKNISIINKQFGLLKNIQ